MKKKGGLNLEIRCTIDQEKLFEVIPDLLDDLSELHDMVSQWNQPEAEKIVKEIHSKIASLIDVS